MAEYVSTLQPHGALTQPPPAPYRFFRASDGKTRIDTGNISVIHDPGAAKTVVLDHAKQEAHITAVAPQPPAVPGMPQIPGMPSIPAAPQPPAVHVQDLGKSMMHGQQVEGKRYSIQPSPVAQLPQATAVSHAPGMPQMPQKAPLPPQPQAPTIAEVWSSPQLQLPMATRINGSFGQQTTMCQRALPGEPNPAVFQIPANYKQVLPAAPKAPALPKVPGI